MRHFTTTMPTMKELEQWMLRKMQEAFASAMTKALEMMDQQILEQRDRSRYRVKEERETASTPCSGISGSNGDCTWIDRVASMCICWIV
jgi:Uncharacterised protein family (UPF0236).